MQNEKTLHEQDLTDDQPLKVIHTIAADNSDNGYCQWAVHLDGRYTPTTKTISEIKPGFYTIGIDHMIGPYLKYKSITTDELYELDSVELQTVITELEKFWKKPEIFEKYGFIHKRGVLLYGEPGVGKSGIIQLCTKYLIEKLNGIVISISSGNDIEIYNSLISNIRIIEPNRPITVILEDIDAIAGEGSWSTSMLLNLLDGVGQVNHIVYIATTNYPEALEDRISNRPSRFDYRLEIAVPTEKVRRQYLMNKLYEEELQSIDIDKWVNETEGLSLAHLKELIISVIAMGNSFESTISKLKNLKIKPDLKKKKETKIGFTSGRAGTSGRSGTSGCAGSAGTAGYSGTSEVPESSESTENDPDKTEDN